MCRSWVEETYADSMEVRGICRQEINIRSYIESASTNTGNVLYENEVLSRTDNRSLHLCELLANGLATALNERGAIYRATSPTVPPSGLGGGCVKCLESNAF